MARILFVASVFAHLEAFHLPFIGLLQSKGHIVEAAASSEPRMPDRLRSIGISCFDIPFRRSPFDLGNISAFRSLRDLLTERHYDLIHVHTPVASFMTRLLAQTTKQGRVLYTAHGFHFYRGASIAAWMLYYPAEKLAARWTDGLIVMNQEDLGNAMRLGLEKDRVFLVHGVGVDLKAFDREGALASTSASCPEFQSPVFICVGEMNKNKNQRFLLRGWLHFTRSHRGTLLLVGDGPNKELLMSQVEESQVPGVHFLGYRDDVPDLLLRSDVVILTSLREGLPRCLLEGMAARKPIIATDVRGSRDLVSDGVTGLLVEPGNVLALSSAMKRLAEDVDLRAAMGRKGFERVREYSLDGTVREMAAIYQKYLQCD